jgi:hypothetical protein
VPADQIAAARDKLDMPLDSARFADRMAAFLKRTA